MAISNHRRVGKALELLQRSLRLCIGREFAQHPEQALSCDDLVRRWPEIVRLAQAEKAYPQAGQEDLFQC